MAIKKSFSENKTYQRRCKANLLYRICIFYAYAFSERKAPKGIVLKEMCA